MPTCLRDMGVGDTVMVSITIKKSVGTGDLKFCVRWSKFKGMTKSGERENPSLSGEKANIAENLLERLSAHDQRVLGARFRKRRSTAPILSGQTILTFENPPKSSGTQNVMAPFQ
jgi:hypothetical protein